MIKCNKNNQNKPTPTSPLKKGLLKQHPSPHTHTLPNIKLGTRFGLYFWDFFQLDLGFFFFFSPQILKLTNLEQIIRFWTLKNNLKWSDTSINILQNSLHKYSQSIAQHQNFIYQKKKKIPFPNNIHTITDWKTHLLIP